MITAAETATEMGAGSFIAVCAIALILILAMGGGSR